MREIQKPRFTGSENRGFKSSVATFEMDEPVFPFTAAAVIPYSTHHLLFLKTSTGEEVNVPTYVPKDARTAVYGKKTSTALSPAACCKLPAADLVTFLGACVPPLHGLDRMSTRGMHPILYTRSGVEEVIPRNKRMLLGWRWPTSEEYIFKLPTAASSPATADSTSSLSMLAAAATTVAVANTSGVYSLDQSAVEVDNVMETHQGPEAGAPNQSVTSTANTSCCLNGEQRQV